MAVNIVEMVAEPSDCAFDQRCRFGHRVEGHAVYCHNDGWDDGPRKCRRSWYTGGETKDEDCPGFQPNPEFRGVFEPTRIEGAVCSKCVGSRVRATDRGRIETCNFCMGSGSEPEAIEMSQFEQATLEMGLVHSGRHPAQFEPYVRITKTRGESGGVFRLAELDLIVLGSQSRFGDASVFLVWLTAKGDAVMRANWAAKKAP